MARQRGAWPGSTSTVLAPRCDDDEDVSLSLQ